MRQLNTCDGSRVDGFTLLELLVALAIFGLLSVMSYSGLRSVINQQIHTEEAADRLGEMQKIYLIMQRDIEQVVPRAIRDEYGAELPAVQGDNGLQLTRGGWSNPLNRPRSTLQRIGYTFEERKLVRSAWSVLDRAQDSLPIRQELTEAISNMTIRYLSDKKEWKTRWPVAAVAGGLPNSGVSASPSSVSLPRAIEITLDHEHYGQLVWLFRLP